MEQPAHQVVAQVLLDAPHHDGLALLAAPFEEEYPQAEDCGHKTPLQKLLTAGGID